MLNAKIYEIWDSKSDQQLYLINFVKENIIYMYNEPMKKKFEGQWHS